MKLNITLDLEDIDLWNEDYDLEESVRKALKNEIIREISDKIREKTRDSIEQRCSKYIDGKFDSMVSMYFQDFVQNNKIAIDGKEEMLMSDWIKQYLSGKMRSRFYGGFDSTMEKVAKDFAEDLKKRYDMKFAALIVKNMAEAKLLKDEELAKLIP